jgi:hypothetical protein
MLKEILSVAGRNSEYRWAPVAMADDRIVDSPGSFFEDLVVAESDEREQVWETDTEFSLDWSGSFESPRDFECMGELVLDIAAEPSEMEQVCESLSQSVKGDILHALSKPEGISIFCAGGY